MLFASIKRKKIILDLSYIASLAKRSGVMVMLLAGFVLLLHLMGITWLRQTIDLPSENNAPIPC